MTWLKRWMLYKLLLEFSVLAVNSNNHQLTDCVLVVMDELDEMGRISR